MEQGLMQDMFSTIQLKANLLFKLFVCWFRVNSAVKNGEIYSC